MNKKSQIQIGETIAVLFVFLILIIIGIIFYVKVIRGNIESEVQESSQLSSIGIAQRVMFLPELQCSDDNVIKENCIDVLKLDSAKNLMPGNDVYYYDLFEFSNIIISEIKPDGTTNEIGNIYSRTLTNFKNKFVTNVPISLYDSTTKRNTFGLLTIETYS
jgi:hypothetical protein